MNEKEELQRDVMGYLSDVIEDGDVRKMKEIPHHKKVSAFEHSLKVAVKCLKIKRKLCIGVDERELTRAAFLHDFYLYDWHRRGERGRRFHGFTHPRVAERNAAARFSLNPRERRAIRTHMWPLTPLALPTSRIGWLVTLADKLVSIEELL